MLARVPMPKFGCLSGACQAPVSACQCLSSAKYDTLKLKNPDFDARRSSLAKSQALGQFFSQIPGPGGGSGGWLGGMINIIYKAAFFRALYQLLLVRNCLNSGLPSMFKHCLNTNLSQVFNTIPARGEVFVLNRQSAGAAPPVPGLPYIAHNFRNFRNC